MNGCSAAYASIDVSLHDLSTNVLIPRPRSLYESLRVGVRVRVRVRVRVGVRVRVRVRVRVKVEGQG